MRLRFLARLGWAAPSARDRRAAARVTAGRELAGGGRHRAVDVAGPSAEPSAEAPFGSPVRQAGTLPKPGRHGRPGPDRGPARPQRGPGGPEQRGPGHTRAAGARVAANPAGREAAQARLAGRPAQSADRAAATVAASAARAKAQRRSDDGGLAWHEVAHARRVEQGCQDCGRLEAVLVREWPEGEAPPPQAARAVGMLAALPPTVQDVLAAGLDAIHVGPGGVPELDDMGRLRGVPLPSGRATWDACAGAYGNRKIVVGSRPSAAPDVMCHEVGHALDDIDGSAGLWQSDQDDFCSLYAGCLPYLVSGFHRQEGVLGRREFFADAFAAIASGQRPALLDMLGGHTRSALEVMLYFNLRYGI